MRKETKIKYFLEKEDRKEIKKQMIDKDLRLCDIAEMTNTSVQYWAAIFAGRKQLTPKIMSQLEKCGIRVELLEDNYKVALELACKEFENFVYIESQNWMTKPECWLKKAGEKIKEKK